MKCLHCKNEMELVSKTSNVSGGISSYNSIYTCKVCGGESTLGFSRKLEAK